MNNTKKYTYNSGSRGQCSDMFVPTFYPIPENCQKKFHILPNPQRDIQIINSFVVGIGSNTNKSDEMTI